MYRLDKQFTQYYDTESNVSNLSLDFPHSSAPLASSFMLMMFYNFEDCRDYLKDWLLEEFPYLTGKEIEKELDLFITIKNKFTSKFKKTRYTRYTNSVIENFKDSESSLIDYIITQMETYTKSDFLRGSSIGL